MIAGRRACTIGITVPVVKLPVEFASCSNDETTSAQGVRVVKRRRSEMKEGEQHSLHSMHGCSDPSSRQPSVAAPEALASAFRGQVVAPAVATFSTG
jgi:hypothetical protein